MNCEEMQARIWAGKSGKELQEHLNTCESCQEQVADRQHVIRTLGNLQTPAPSRSLQPSRDVILQTVRRNRRRRWSNVATMAASVVLLLGGGVLANQYLLSPENLAELPILEPDQANSPQVSIATKEYPEFTASIGNRIKHVISKDDYVKITIRDYKPSANSSSQVAMGEVLLEMEAAPNVTSAALRNTTQIGHVRFTQQNGKWVADLIDQEIIPKSPDEAVKQWAEAIKKQDGLLEYATFDAALKEQSLSSYQQNQWNIGTFSPRVESYTIEWYDKYPLADRIPNGENDYMVTFRLADSSGIVGAKRIAVSTRKYDNKYYVFEKELKEELDKYMVSTLTLPDKTEIISKGNQVKWEPLDIQMFVQHVVKQESATKTAFGNTESDQVPNYSFPVEITNLAGAHIYEFRGTKRDPDEHGGTFFLIVERTDPQDETKTYVYMLRVQFTGEQKAAQHLIIKLAADWKLPL